MIGYLAGPSGDASYYFCFLANLVRKLMPPDEETNAQEAKSAWLGKIQSFDRFCDGAMFANNLVRLHDISSSLLYSNPGQITYLICQQPCFFSSHPTSNLQIFPRMGASPPHKHHQVKSTKKEEHKSAAAVVQWRALQQKMPRCRAYQLLHRCVLRCLPNIILCPDGLSYQQT